MPAVKRFALLLLVLRSLSGQAQAPLEIHHLTGDFYVYTTYNSYKGTLFPSNGLYMLSEEGALLLDSPWDTTQFQPLLDSIRSRHHQAPVLMIATHSHEDRTAALEYYGKQGIATYTSRRTDSISCLHAEPRAGHTFAHDTVFTLGSHRFMVFYPGEGHTPDNVVVWFEQERILYGGCLVKSTEAQTLGNLADANIKAWPTTIRHLQQRFPDPAYVIPGHQDWSNRDALQHTLKLLDMHNKQ